MNYIRFQIHEKDPWSTKSLGIFHAIADLRDGGTMLDYHQTHADDLRKWFNDHLEAPGRFSRKKDQRKTRWISRWKETATEYIEKMEEIIYLLGEYDIVVEKITSDNPGYIVYEDDYQIVAEPFKDSL